MNLQQFRYVSEVARRGLNISEAAAALHTSQPGVSRQLRELERELGSEIFVRQGKRLTAVTDAGREIVAGIDRILAEIGNLKSVGQEYADSAKGSLAVAVTHTQARYALPPVVTEFKKHFPHVRLKLLQGNPHQLARHVLDGDADFAIATEALMEYPQLITLPAYQWHHCVVVPASHPLAKMKRITLEAIAEHPIVTYDPTFAGRTAIDRVFLARGLTPDIVLTALDSDVIKSYVTLGLGVGIISEKAFRPGKDEGLVALDAAHLFPTQTTRIAFKRGAYLRGYMVEFLRLFAPRFRIEDLKQLEAAPRESFEI
ncbi:HTH-type transcriptional regulator CysB [Usitatibacter rugosus]|uniref:HTH-type transcriptional regulator CysB n=1 Tax=Usitatibacter rugosus TaxID=2732067 RepID=A0A6M4GYX5_9PROT|nr:CysB family HTH-type transcriptional regulator [Usitatibacter rugosus]QJR11613.1 HTH-type transcriptional regulator CysB [Usitatibacter rugosus]